MRLLDAPLDVVLSNPTDVTMHGATLTWTQNTEPNFGQYEIYRSTTSPTLNSTLVATIDDQTTTEFNDVYTILQPNTYRYKMWVVDDLGRYSPGSNEVEATYSIPEVPFPLFDDMEGTTENWDWGAPWGLITTGDPANTVFTDSPLGPYADNANTALTTNVDLALAASPVLTFRHTFALEEARDFGYVEISTDDGGSWTKLLTVTGVEGWNAERINLRPFTGQLIGIRFRLTSDGAGRADGWLIDDVRIADEATAASYPFFDDVEAGPGVWFYDSPWGRTREDSYSGRYSWTDSPNTGYADNVSTSLRMSIDLSPALMPVLSFRHQYSLQENADYGFVEVSTDGGGSWRQIYFVTGGTSEWLPEMVDLGEYAGKANVMIRFRMASNGSTTSNGWLLDDIRIDETSAGPVEYPFFDDMERGTGDWISGSWGRVTQGHSGIQSWNESPQGNYALDTWSELVLSNAIDLNTAANPKLIFWHKYDIYDFDGHDGSAWIREHDRGRVYISNFYGQGGTWTQLRSYWGKQGEWEMVQIDLADWAGLKSVRIKFVLDDARDTHTSSGINNHQRDGWHIDDVRIQDSPEDVVLSPPGNVTMHGADLSWTQNTEATFNRYEVYRSTGIVTTSSTLIATIDDQSITSFSDVYTILEPDSYRHKIWVVDDLGVYSLGSNEVVATYELPEAEYPMFDDMEGTTDNWEWSSPWGLTSVAYSGSGAWADSPVGPYADGANTALTTSISLAGAGSPVLTFWHKSALELGKDFGYVEVSNNGGATWTKVFSATGTEGWNQEKVDLSGYVGDLIHLRFRLDSDGSGRADGWYIDNVSIDEGILRAGYPYFDDMETGSGAWFYDSPWGLTDEEAHSGTFSWSDSPNSVYGNNVSTALQISINLSVSEMPVLEFWQIYSLEENRDFGYVEVSTNAGANWTQLYFVTGGGPGWVKELVDLSSYAGKASLMIRFRVGSNGSTTADGWYIDDVRVREAAPPSMKYPFFDGMERGGANWASGSWELVPTSYEGDNAWHESPRGQYALDTWSELVLSNVVDLSSADNPQLTFWHKYEIYDFNGHDGSAWIREHDRGRVYISNYFGQEGTWEQLVSYFGSLNEWTRVQIDIPAKYAGLDSVRIKFVLDDSRDTHTSSGINNHQRNGWYIDNVRINEKDELAPAAIDDLNATGFTPSSAELSLTAVDNDGGLGTATVYDVRYSTSPITEANWDSATQVSGEPAPQPAGFRQAFTVTGLPSATQLYFAMKVSDQDGNTSALSNVAGGSTLEAGGVNVTVDAPTYVLASGDFTAVIRISQVENFDAANYTVTYDSAVLRLTNVTGGQINGTDIPVTAWSTGDGTGNAIVVQNVPSTPGIDGTGRLAVLHFRVIGTGSDTSDIGLIDGVLGDNVANPIDAAWFGDSVEARAVLPGDANGDGQVSALDITKTEMIILGQADATPGADANEDGTVNALDITMVERFIAGLA